MKLFVILSILAGCVYSNPIFDLEAPKIAHGCSPTHMFYGASISAYLAALALLVILGLVKLSARHRKDHGAVCLKAKTSFSNRGLSFSEGKEYTFHYAQGVLICNSDDTSKWRDNYNFHGADLDNFEPVGAYSRKIIKEVKGEHNV